MAETSAIAIVLAIVLIIITVIICGLWNSIWVTSRPDEWCLIIRNGNCVEKGVGLACFKRYWDQAIKFSSNLH